MNKIVNIGLTALFACFVAACKMTSIIMMPERWRACGTIYDKETNEPVLCLCREVAVCDDEFC